MFDEQLSGLDLTFLTWLFGTAGVARLLDRRNCRALMPRESCLMARSSLSAGRPTKMTALFGQAAKSHGRSERMKTRNGLSLMAILAAAGAIALATPALAQTGAEYPRTMPGDTIPS